MTPRAPAMSPEDRRSAIVEVTIPLLREHGPALTTKQVAEAAGIAEGTVFRAFGTKEELVGACAAAVFDTTAAVARLRGIDPGLTLDERLAAGVAVMHAHLERAIGLMATLHSAAVPPQRPPDGPPKRRSMSDPAVDAAFVDLIGPDAGSLRFDPSTVVNILAHLTLSSAHPMFPVRSMTPAEIVSVVLDGTRHHTDREAR
ncbi:TetR/AcrR family transcriptional regulator [Phycicoccus jejuensis]|uniref:TetR/AcrR family transcriptional regulator n=1 Tax=Phycicoccus TaxID=367298 RepID=UPI001A8D7B7A|nr:TetR/AcrR family transcriptional regulator [Phycicoccus sp. DTK01]GIL35256.1 TetR family transcriptional regulator [Phycicoccus sp. DTK01]